MTEQKDGPRVTIQRGGELYQIVRTMLEVAATGIEIDVAQGDLEFVIGISIIRVKDENGMVWSEENGDD